MICSLPQVAYGLETPYPLQPCQNYFRLEGWALIRGSDRPTRTRMRVGPQVFEPDSESERPDVVAKFPDDPFAAQTGFSFVCFLPFGNHFGELEVSNDEGRSWILVKSMVIPVSSHPLMGEFEPAGSNGLISQPIRLAGWCWHPEFKIATVTVLFGNIAVPTEFGLNRPDVGQRFPHQPEAEFAGFITQENLPRGKGPIRLQVTTSCGRIYFLRPPLEADLPEGAYAPPRAPRDMWDLDTHDNLRQRRQFPSPSRPPGLDLGPTNILFVLYGDFTSNSAHHVAAFANELIARGYDCIVAVPAHMETIGAQSHARFLAIEFEDIDQLPGYYRDGLAPTLIHAWTTRQSVQAFCQQAQSLFHSQLIIHLEDNEREILARHLGCSLPELALKSAAELSTLVPASLSHPLRADDFLGTARGVTVILDQLKEFVPPEVPATTIWPAAQPWFSPRKPNSLLREKLGIPLDDVVLFYHGNVHQANIGEMTELYRAVQQLNDAGVPTWLIRTGRDTPKFTASLSPSPLQRVIALGFIKRSQDLPPLMSMADYFVQPGQAGAFNDYRFPSKLPEFFGIGRPVILPCTNLGKILRHGRDAFVLETADAAAIAKAVQELQADPTLRRTLTEGALKFAQQNFSWAHSTDLLLRFYLQVTALGTPSLEALAAAKTVTMARDSSSLAPTTDLA